MDAGGSSLMGYSSDRMKSVIIVGVGNEYRRDDGIGIVVARHLKSMLDSNDVDVVEVSDASSIIDVMEMGYKKMIIVDAIHSSAAVGTIYRFSKEEMLNMTNIKRYLLLPSSASSTHAMDIVEALKLAIELGIARDMDVVMFGVEGKDFGLGRGLSKEVERSIHRVVEEVAKEIVRVKHNNA
ncbi:MAG: hydrogenase maturation protease [Candidatus Nitrosocaldus sp.]